MRIQLRCTVRDHAAYILLVNTDYLYCSLNAEFTCTVLKMSREDYVAHLLPLQVTITCTTATEVHYPVNCVSLRNNRRDRLALCLSCYPIIQNTLAMLIFRPGIQ